MLQWFLVKKLNEDDIYGELYLHVKLNPNPDLNNANNMALKGVKNPRELLDLIRKYSPNIIVSDDKPTFLGKKY